MKKKSLTRFTGRNNLMVVAPHAANGKGNDDFVGTIYDSVKLAVDEHRLATFSVYGKVGHSHKVYLTHLIA